VANGLEYIRDAYRVPARLGRRVRLTSDGKSREGTIQGARGPHLLVLFDGELFPASVHPTWNLDYLEDFDIKREPKVAAGGSA
jgi:hypothetical protein